MKRKKKEDPEAIDPGKFWPVPGVDGEPYPPRVQEALDLVAEETLRRQRAECAHTDRIFVSSAHKHRYGALEVRRVCRDCHVTVACEHPPGAIRVESVRSVGGYSLDGFVRESACRCGHRTSELIKPEPHMRTVPMGLPYEKAEPPCPIPIMVRPYLKDSEPREKEGPFHDSLVRTLDEELQRLGKLLAQTEPYGEGVLRNARGDVVFRSSDDIPWY